MAALDEVVTFLRASPAFHVATVDADGFPRNRPFSLVFEYAGHLVFATGSGKKIYAELQNKPYVEISSFDSSNFSWIRIHGEVKWLDDLNAKKKVFEVMPQLTEIYKSAENPVLKTFYIEGKVDFYGSGPGPSKSIDIN
jgi:uncharacterized pyridoxamine 5'-phosphate oxidase family protein